MICACVSRFGYYNNNMHNLRILSDFLDVIVSAVVWIPGKNLKPTHNFSTNLMLKATKIVMLVLGQVYDLSFYIFMFLSTLM